MKKSESNILVVATMSAGKTSVINALIGQELLHSGNEATTSCITSIEYVKEGQSYSGVALSSSGVKLFESDNATLQLMKEWNANSDVNNIRLFNVSTQNVSSPEIIIHDTPGPNNSQNIRHAKLVEFAFSNIKFDGILYVLNVTQLAIEDDCELLSKIKNYLKYNPRKNIYFVLNKIDLLDEEKGEKLADYVSNSVVYLEKLGFSNPIIIPVMANLALFARKAQRGEALTRTQLAKLNNAVCELKHNKRKAIECAKAPNELKKKAFNLLRKTDIVIWLTPPVFGWRSKKLYRQVYLSSGLSLLENYLNIKEGGDKNE